MVLSGQKVAAFTWEGAALELEGQPDVVYESDETPMSSYLNIHDTLEAQRTKARASHGEGPRTLVVGPTDSGKSTLCRLLSNYAVRTTWAPTVVDLDIGQGTITVPGCLAATPVEAPVDLEEGLPVDAPLVYYYGSLTPGDNPDLYRHLVERIGSALDARAARDDHVRASGLVINSMGWVEGVGYELLCHAARALRVDCLLVLGAERLHSQLAADFRGSGVSLIKLARSGGVVERSRELRQRARRERVDDYFYGPRRTLAPASAQARWEDLEVYRVGGGPRAPTSALPIGASSVADPLRLTRITSPSDLLYCILAVSHAPEPALLLASNVAGFIYVQDVDVAKGTVTYLAPCPGALPAKYLLAGSFKVYLD